MRFPGEEKGFDGLMSTWESYELDEHLRPLWTLEDLENSCLTADLMEEFFLIPVPRAVNSGALRRNLLLGIQWNDQFPVILVNLRDLRVVNSCDFLRRKRLVNLEKVDSVGRIFASSIDMGRRPLQSAQLGTDLLNTWAEQPVISGSRVWLRNFLGKRQTEILIIELGAVQSHELDLLTAPWIEFTILQSFPLCLVRRLQHSAPLACWPALSANYTRISVDLTRRRPHSLLEMNKTTFALCWWKLASTIKTTFTSDSDYLFLEATEWYIYVSIELIIFGSIRAYRGL